HPLQESLLAPLDERDMRRDVRLALSHDLADVTERHASIAHPFHLSREPEGARRHAGDVFDERHESGLLPVAVDDLGHDGRLPQLLVGQKPTLPADEFVGPGGGGEAFVHQDRLKKPDVLDAPDVQVELVPLAVPRERNGDSLERDFSVATIFHEAERYWIHETLLFQKGTDEPQPVVAEELDRALLPVKDANAGLP